ncbi:MULTISPECIES: Nif3-like dinuclear metal center hexameric protein [Clostridium]|uniref:GTP cyclohydrolase 1 type 2 homolog n=2 Tax=Clostridium TaxID=1485 RepID=A0A151ALU0_9CLOT|nr:MULTISPECIES: Nif3-like dinuclear metal center hexameric protein [Clostridium]KYH28596.1 putative GTP cyclohydrolase 1 type 2 [Clostridium colicanis DSM 13634]MBE6042888.1 Nif3-like dinuclear metal center hexameric protein [Clostridium thermopalmarium]PRR74116.1 putative GTP cyclohydrolase 1 type 2 [Clostridium thermopalmarium DSM 5974]PVZ25444.1 dinuclear metal center YbgI/SA1388 family protein [Clostridium thermopalmarium DSM 5974]
MALKIRDIKEIIEKFAPINLKESYDNVGLMVGELDKEITSILVALDCTMEVIKEAVEKNCNLIITHHPLLFKKPSSITGETLVGRKIMELIKNDISLYSAHTNLDSVDGGINDTVMNLLGLNEYVTMELSSERYFEDNKSGIGRLANLNETITLKDLCNRVKKSFKIPYVRYAGEDFMKIKKVAVINGSGQEYFSLAKKMGADCIITGDTSYHYVSDFSEEGIGIIDAGHFGTEWPAFKILAFMLESKLQRDGHKNRIFVSEKVKDPYKIY